MTIPWARITARSGLKTLAERAVVLAADVVLVLVHSFVPVGSAHLGSLVRSS
jgi:hypothetical protein